MIANSPHRGSDQGSTKSRISFNYAGYVVTAYPSEGGHVKKELTRVDLNWLGLTSTSTSDPNFPIGSEKMMASRDQVEEDAFALQMMQLGARWSPERECRRLDIPVPYGHHLPPDLEVGYPDEGGVLVLRTCADNSHKFESLKAPPPKPDDLGRLYLCNTMEERCAVLGSFGAAFYSTIEECPDLPQNLEDGIAIGRYFEVMMKKMVGDPLYLERWTDSL